MQPVIPSLQSDCNNSLHKPQHLWRKRADLDGYESCDSAWNSRWIAIHRGMEELLEDENVESISERAALRNALITLTDLQQIALARKPDTSVRRESGQA